MGNLYNINRSSACNIFGKKNLIPSFYKSIIRKPNFYDYTRTKNCYKSEKGIKQESYNYEVEKTLSDFDLYLIKLRESRKEAETKKKFKRMQKLIKDQEKCRSIEKQNDKKRKYNKKNLQKSVPEEMLDDQMYSPTSLKSVCVRVNRLRIQSLSPLKDLTSTTSKIENCKNKNHLNYVEQDKISNENSVNEQRYKNLDFSYETLQNIVENVEDNESNSSLKNLVSNQSIDHDKKDKSEIIKKRQYFYRKLIVRIKRLKINKNLIYPIKNNAVFGINSENIPSISNQIINESHKNITNENLSQPQNKKSHHIFEEWSDTIKSKTDVVADSKIKLCIKQSHSETSSEVAAVVNFCKENIPTDENNQKNNQIRNQFQSLTEITNPAININNSTIYCKNKESELISNRKENEVTSTQESEVSSSLDLQFSTIKRRKCRKTSVQENDNIYGIEFALNCDEAESNAPTTTTIFDYFLTKKRKRRQKKFDVKEPEIANENLSIINSLENNLISHKKSIANSTKKTYSNLVSTVFVPPDVEEMIHKDIETLY